ncbi:MAG: zinc ribbon domain-containing protein, partial [Gammaproteobacteria bacterium]
SKEHSDALLRTQCAFSQACNHIVPTAIAERCISRNKLHHLVYYPVRESSILGSQMVCNAIAKVSWALTAQKKRDGQVNPKTRFSDTSQDCCECGARGQRIKHRFRCLACKATRHADVNAALNHRGLALAIASATGVRNASECTSCF